MEICKMMKDVTLECVVIIIMDKKAQKTTDID